MIFLYQIFQLWIFLLQMSISVGFYFGVTHAVRQMIFSAGLACKTLFRLLCALITHYLTLDLGTHGIQRQDTAFAFLVNDMPSVVRADRGADLAFLQTECGFFKRLYHHSLAEPS